MISIDMTSGAGTVTPPAVGLCSADKVVVMAPYAAPENRTGLPVAGTTGALRPSVRTTAPREFAVAGVPAGHTSSTPGDLPPEDPLG